MAGHRIYKLAFSDLYPNYVHKVERKNRTVAELNEVIRWLTGYSQQQLDALVAPDTTTNLQEFFAEAPRLHVERAQIRGLICGVRIEEIEDPLMREIRYLDKLVDELARGRAMEKILRAPLA